jgi:hypothetical protein
MQARSDHDDRMTPDKPEHHDPTERPSNKTLGIRPNSRRETDGTARTIDHDRTKALLLFVRRYATKRGQPKHVATCSAFSSQSSQRDTEVAAKTEKVVPAVAERIRPRLQPATIATIRHG